MLRERRGLNFSTLVLIPLSILLFFGYSAMGSVVKEKDKREILNKAYTLKIPFIENKGQIKGQSVKYYAKTFGGTVFVTKDGKLVYSLPKFEEKEKVKGWVIKEGLVGASISNVKGEEEAVTKVSYFKGKDPSKWERNISTYNLVSLGEVYKGIEVKVKAHGKNVEKLFYIEPGADPESIKIKIEGAKSLRINEAGELEVETGLGVIKFTKPVAYQEINGKRIEVVAAYTLLSNPQYVYGFKVGSYDKKETLIIDPLLASTFIGGSSVDYGLSVALNGDGNVYITGHTWSSDYPTTSGAYDESYNYDSDVFVSKLNSSLSTLLSSTFIGGSNYDCGCSIALDGDGNVYITGKTYSSNYPTTLGAYDESHNGYYDVFVSRLDSNLSAAAPLPDIKVNGSDGPITLYQNDTLTITVSLNNNGITDNADWWLAADTPFGLYFYTFSGWVPYQVPVYQHPLFYLPTYEVFSTSVSWLQEGTYTFYFGVDMVMDGIITWDSLYYDTVEVNITQ